MIDLCLSCVLPDCDETSRGCHVRQLYRQYNAKVRLKLQDQISDEERVANNMIFETYDLERRALAAEHVRPYRRAGSAWTGADASPAPLSDQNNRSSR